MDIPMSGATNTNNHVCAITVYGERKSENRVNKKYRVFRLGKDQFKEVDSYDHVEVKACFW